MFNRLNWIILIFLIQAVSTANATTITPVVKLDENIRSLSIGKYVAYFNDSTQQLEINDILSGGYDTFFQLSDKEVLNFGNQIATYWNKFTIYNAASENIRWLLILDEHHLDTLELYYPDEAGIYHLISDGRSKPYNERGYKYNNYAFDLKIKSGDTAVFYLKVQSHLMIYPVQVKRYEEFIANSMDRHIAKGIIIGLFLMIILYNFFIYLSVNDRNYLYYTAYACWNILMICDLTGYMDFAWQGPLSFMWDKTPAIIAIDGIFLMLFSKHILEFDRYFPFANKFIHYFLIPVACWTIIANCIGLKLYASITNQTWVLILVVFLYISAIIVYRRGFLPARFYIIACVFFFIACATYAATLLGFIPVNTFTNHVIETGSGLEMLLFSFALADKIRQFRKDKSKAQTQLLNTLKENEQLILDQNINLKTKVAERTRDLEIEKEKSDQLLKNILPESVAEELKEKGFSEARQFDQVNIMFIEFFDFNNISKKMNPDKMVSEIDHCFKKFDQIISKFGLEKIKSFGAAYLAVSGFDKENTQAAKQMARAALEIRKFMVEYQQDGGVFQIKIGIHNGSVIAGIVGIKKFAYDIWGDEVNTAARMEQHSLPGRINISGKLFEQLGEDFECQYRGKIEAKNKGVIDMYFIENQK
jgi:class 3 adenylate cyclase